jgi:PII-like signaling protein
MQDSMGVQVTIYLNEADEWHHKPLYLELLKYLRAESVAGATVLHGYAGFTGRQKLETAHLVDVGGRLPVVLVFIDTEEHVQRVLPTLRQMAPQRLIVRENVHIEQGLG